MKKSHIVPLACAAGLLGVGLGAAPAPAAHEVHLVHEGQSIQKAVDAAQPGDTVVVLAGVYHESVTVRTRGLTLRGLGASTVIEPTAAQLAAAAAPATGTAAAPKKEAAKKSAAKKATKKAADKAAKKAAKKSARKRTPVAPTCEGSGNGICVIGTKDKALSGVMVTDLTVRDFPKNGVWAMGTDRLTVRGVVAVNNGQWGIAQERSTRAVIRGNSVRGSGDAGLFLGNTVSAEQGATDTLGTRVVHNDLRDNRIGLTVRRLRDLTVTRNVMTANCAAVFVVGDENKPKAGDITIGGNRIERNNKYCAKTARLPFLQGSGIILTGAENTQVMRNTITGNTGTSPLSGGIVLFKSFVGVTSEHNRITDNTLSGNGPADLVNQEATASGNVFQSNSCRASRPTGLC
ncbi:right-handed parallel beta-helix repeat-containing protein [Streptomyces mangrovisoli]|uniref:Right handed beta helix domain-containing protein n=1 Tax=Streptomyces mangrovisoli TaxID=1428628 RepID=A0A1J4NW54_9ACTN|nr:right-handed parallel beta-helix repeat-containing protein [Streptomyces mangrovisoli]OIJ66571.1 hypothetical protein WN71_017925 [Streptomyces mangrovisoli]